MRVNINPLIISCGTRTDPAAETKSIGLPADHAFGDGRRTGAMFFARHLDCFIMTLNLSHIFQIRDFGSGQIRFTETILSFAVTGKNCAIPSSPPGQITTKEPGLVAGWFRRVTFTPSTAGPLCCNYLFILRPLTRLHPDWFAVTTGQINYTKTIF